MQADKIIIGAGLYGLYSALFSAKNDETVVVLECDASPFGRATYCNQARLHQGYHYPRSISTAMKSAGYFARFNRDYAFCVNREFDQIYATSSNFSWSNGKQFSAFCKAAGIPCEELIPEHYFKEGMCDGAFRTREYSYDAVQLRDYFTEKIKEYPNVRILYNSKICKISRNDHEYSVFLEDGDVFSSDFVLNASYAGTNQIHRLAGFDSFRIKYELCEIILCNVNEPLRDIGFTVMDGPFFSIMPFGKTGFHSLTSVAFTPHSTCYGEYPVFHCQQGNTICSAERLGNCNECSFSPETAFPYMAKLARKYLRDEFGFRYEKSLFSMKPILLNSEIDDSRPTVIQKFSEHPTFISVLSGKINTVFDLDEVLKNDN